MAKIIENNKGFKIIEVSLDEVQQKYGGFGICDWCNGDFNKFMYISVLNHCYCQDCYDNWNERAIYYEEDSNIEAKNFERSKELLEIK